MAIRPGFTTRAVWTILMVIAVRCPGANPAPLQWETSIGYRSAALPVPATGHSGFTLLQPSQTGVNSSNSLADTAVAMNRLLEIGSGVALGDVDGDGWVDIYLCRIDGSNVMYRNLGNWRFEDITARAGVECAGQHSTGAVLVDLDGDGDLDLLVNSLGGGTHAFLNDGEGHFTPFTESGLREGSGATSMALADVDGDGDLDLYVTNYRTDTFQDRIAGMHIQTRQLPDGRKIVEPADRFIGVPTRAGPLEVIERGEPDVFYLNQGGGHFIAVPWDKGIFLDEEGQALRGPPTDWGLSVMFRDLNGDGLPDLYVCNDFIAWPDRIWLNQNGKRFRAAPRAAVRCVSLASMSADVADINRDGYDDIFVADMLSPHRRNRAWQRPDTLSGVIDWPLANPSFRPEVPRNTLQLARGDGTFAEIARFSGVAATDWSWGTAFLDVDLDGWEDLLVATGSNHDVQDADVSARLDRTDDWKTTPGRHARLKKTPRRETPSVALRNCHDLTFEDVSAVWGFNATGIAQGMAMADLDNDGDLDVVVNCLNAPARLYRNESSAPRLAVRLRGTGANTRGIGAKIKILGGPVNQTQEMISGGRYCSSDDAMRVFAAGTAAELQIEVTWRKGTRSVIAHAHPNRVYEVIEAESPSIPSAPPPVIQPLFQDATQELGHVHQNTPFDDFERQPLLPRKLSTLGPGIAWFDLDGSGRDALIVGGGRGGRTAVCRPTLRSEVQNEAVLPSMPPNPRSQTSLAAWHGANGTPRVLVGESTWEKDDEGAPAFQELKRASDRITWSPSGIRSEHSSTGPIAAADVDGDGVLDLFVGGRVVPGRYPEPAGSRLYRGVNQGWEVAQEFPRFGLVTAAVFFDFDDDGDDDLAVATEWGGIRLFRNDQGKLIEVTDSVGLKPFQGFWNGLAVGDFDGDGRLDLAASNWGRNWRPDRSSDSPPPVDLYYGDFSEDGTVQTLVGSLDPELGVQTPWRQKKVVAQALPSLVFRFPTFRDYGRSSIQQLLGDRASVAIHQEAMYFDSTVFLNRGGRFEAVSLPKEAQFAPAFGITVADFDGDGKDDLFLAQNFFGVDEESSRGDSGVGLILIGDGQGGFRSLSPLESGISIPGEQRGAAVADYDGDGRVDLAVAQHGGATCLFHNVAGRAGVRVKLRGPMANPDAIGAKVRVRFGNRWSPVREIRAGGGYWSQDSTTMVFGAPASPAEVQVVWPGGRRQFWPWPTGATGVQVSAEGTQAW